MTLPDDKLLEEFVDDMKYLVTTDILLERTGIKPDVKIETIFIDAKRLHENMYRQQLKAAVVNKYATTKYCNLKGISVVNYDSNFSILTMVFNTETIKED